MAKFRTKKDAREAGYLTFSEWVQKGKVPERGAVPEMVKGEAFFVEAKCEDLVSATEAGQRGLRVRNGSEAVHTKYWYAHRVHYNVFRISDCEPKRSVTDIPAKSIDILLAVFTVNKAAKRFRDASQGQYRAKRHGFAGASKDRKDRLYALKDKGVIAAYRAGRLAFVGVHGGLAVYQGDGYCFHSTLIPDGDAPSTGELAQSGTFFKEAAPKKAGEARLKDAEHTLEELKRSDDGFTRLPRPAIKA